MDSLDVVLVCLKRWYIMLAVLGLTAGAGMGLVQAQKPSYHAFATYALVFENGDSIRPNEPDPRNANPLAANGGALIGESLISYFMSGQAQLEYGGVGNSGDGPGRPNTDSSYSVALPSQGTSAYVVETWGPSRVGVEEVVNLVLSEAPKKAAQIQTLAGAPRASQYTTFVTSPTQVVVVPPQSRVKLLLAVSAVGLMAGAAVSLVVDRISARRKRTRAARRTDPEDGTEPAAAPLDMVAAPPDKSAAPPANGAASSAAPDGPAPHSTNGPVVRRGDPERELAPDPERELAADPVKTIG